MSASAVLSHVVMTADAHHSSSGTRKPRANLPEQQLRHALTSQALTLTGHRTDPDLCQHAVTVRTLGTELLGRTLDSRTDDAAAIVLGRPRNPRYIRPCDGRPATMQSYNASGLIVTPQQYQVRAEQPSGSHIISSADYYTLASGLTQQNVQQSLPHLDSPEWSTLSHQEQANATYGANRSGMPTYRNAIGLYGSDPSLHLKMQSLPVLDQLSDQIITALAKTSVTNLERTGHPHWTQADEENQALATRKNIFDQTCKVYSRGSAFIDPQTVGLLDVAQQQILRKANRAIYISSLLYSQNLSLFDLNKYFLDVFVAPGQSMSTWHANVLLELKTQAYISALLCGDYEPLSALHELFPIDQEIAHSAPRMQDQHVSVVEKFMHEARLRQQQLAAQPLADALTVLSMRFPWSSFINEFARQININLAQLIGLETRNSDRTRAECNEFHMSETSDSLKSVSPTGTDSSWQHSHNNHGSVVGSSSGFPDPAATHTDHSHPLRSSKGAASSRTGFAGNDAEGAMITHKSATSGPATRQPWTPEEEAALLAGLTEVKGQHWSRILSLYGKGGTKGDVLRNRSQIQLKDKARNMKLWHLKMGNTVPACLQGVTGDLQKRGGARMRAAMKVDDGG